MIGGIIPEFITKRIARELSYVGIDIEEKRFAGFLFVFVTGLSLTVSLNIFFFYKFPVYLSFPGIALLLFGLVIYWLKMVSQSKAKQAENALPDALELIASNIKAGMTTERALFESAREEFGPLSKELKTASRKIITGQRTDIALGDIPKRIKSPLLERTIELLIQGIRSGGQITDLLFQISDSIREENATKEEIKANISMYIMMIFITATFGAPLLFGISSYIVGVVSESSMREVSGELPTSASVGVAGRITSLALEQSKEKVSEEFIVLFAELALLITAVFSALTIGIIQIGSEINGVKFIPVILVVSFVLFFFVRGFLEQMIGQIGFLV